MQLFAASCFGTRRVVLQFTNFKPKQLEEAAAISHNQSPTYTVESNIARPVTGETCIQGSEAAFIFDINHADASYVGFNSMMA